MAIRNQIDQQLAASEPVWRNPPEIPIARGALHDRPQFSVLGYWHLREDPDMPKVGDLVYCTVTQCQGWMTVTAVKGDKRDLSIKTDVFGRSWGYGHNFTFNPPAWMLPR